MNDKSKVLEGAAGSPLRLGAVLDLKAAADLHRDISAHRGQDLVLDASDVTRLGGQCLQVLLAAVFAWRADKRDLSFDHPSAAFIQALDSFGFAFAGTIHKERLT